MSERDSEGVREREKGGGGTRRGKQRTSLLGRRKRPHCGGAASERRGQAAWSPGRPDLRVRAEGCWHAPSTGRSGLGAAGAAGPGKRSGGSGRWGQAGAGSRRGLKCIQNESAGSLGLGVAGAAGTAPARGGGRGARDSVAAGSQAPASASRAG